MGYFFLLLVARHLPGALLLFPLIWFGLFIRNKEGQKLKIGKLWLIGGLFATAIGAGAVRFMAIFVIGEKAALNPGGGSALGMFFNLALPMLVAIGVCAFLRTRSIPLSGSEQE